jgi:hypothetical protein
MQGPWHSEAGRQHREVKGLRPQDQAKQGWNL